MNTTSTIRRLGGFATVLAAAGLLGAASPQDEPARELRSLLDEAASVSSSAVHVMSDGTDVVEVRVNDGDITVKIDGKEIPPDRVRREGDRLIILDENGQPMQTVEIRIGDGPKMIDLFQRGPGEWHARLRELAAESNAQTPRVMLGIQLDHPGAALEYHLGLAPDATTMISGVYEGLPAEQAGLREHDVVIAIDGQTPADPASLRKALAEKKPGDPVELTIIQAGKKRTLSITLAAFDEKALAEATYRGTMPHRGLFELDRLGHPGGRLHLLPGGGRGVLVNPDSDDIFDRTFIGVPELDARIREELDRQMPQWRDRTLLGPGTDRQQQIERLEKRLEELTERLNRLLEERDN